jgi:uncharacterized protein
MKRVRRRWLVALAVLGAAVVLYGFGRQEAQADVRVAHYTLPTTERSCPAGPLRIAVAGDLHVSKGTTPPQSIAAMVRIINAQRPDFVFLVGDYLSSDWPDNPAGAQEALAPLADLAAPRGKVAVLGNNDYDMDEQAIEGALTDAGVTVLNNDALLSGEVAVIGLKDLRSNDANPFQAFERLRDRAEVQHVRQINMLFFLAHQPEMFRRLPMTGDLLVTGHTHGGQVLPTLTVPAARGIVSALQALGREVNWPAFDFVRGLYEEGDKRMLVTSGVGTSDLPLRLGVPPEIAIVDIPGCK